MGIGVLRITPELLLENLLRLQGYKLRFARLSYKTGAPVVELVVEADEIPPSLDGRNMPVVTPSYKQHGDMYELEGVHFS